jgi:hypothetical protein
VGTPCRRVAPLPYNVCVVRVSCAHGISASRTCGICISGASCTNSPSTSGSCCTTVGCGELRGTEVWSPALTGDDTTRDGCGDIIRRAADRWLIGVVEVQLLPHANHLFEFKEVRRRRSHISNRRIHVHIEKTPAR